MKLAASVQLEHVARTEVEKPLEARLLQWHPEALAFRRLVVIAELERQSEDADREPQPVVLGQVDQVGLRDPPSLEVSGTV